MSTIREILYANRHNRAGIQAFCERLIKRSKEYAVIAATASATARANVADAATAADSAIDAPNSSDGATYAGNAATATARTARAINGATGHNAEIERQRVDLKEIFGE